MITRTRILSLSALGVLIAGLATSADPPSGGKKQRPPLTDEELQKLKGPIPPWIPAAHGRDVNDVRKEGKVVATAKDSITILVDGEKNPTKYLAHEVLNSGRIIYWEGDPTCYLLEDVKVGDEVSVGTGTIKDTTFALYISILKRPEGKIPPSRNPNTSQPWHEWKQARIDLEEKGTPIPEHLQDKKRPDDRPKPVKEKQTETAEKKDDKK
jgi:hypothetical protein